MYGYSICMLWNIHIIKLSVLPRLIQCQSSPNHMPVGLFLENDKLILKMLWKYKEPRIHRAVLKNNKPGGHILLRTKTLKDSCSEDRGIAARSRQWTSGTEDRIQNLNTVL